MQTISGDLITLARSGRFDLVIHGCNCMVVMGAGVAKGIKAAFPAAFAADAKTKPGDRSKLGTCTSARVTTAAGDLVVVNAYTQYDWRGVGVKVDYDALARCLRWVKDTFPGRRIGIPRIGAGLAGGDWNRIVAIIEQELAGEDVTVVEYATPNR